MSIQMLERSTTGRKLEELYNERQAISAHWRVISTFSSWFLLGGFLLLLTTFDKDPELRMSDTVVIVLTVALLTAGYGISVLVWFACPSTVFRLESILLPAVASSIFGFLACMWALASSTRYDPTQAGFPSMIGLTLLSALIFGALAIVCQVRLRRVTSASKWNKHSSLASYSSSAHNASSSYHSHQTGGHHHRNMSSIHQPLTQQAASQPESIPMTEEDLISQQMAGLLKRADPRPSPDPTQSTFNIQWPAGDIDDDNDTDSVVAGSGGNDNPARARATSETRGGTFLSPEAALQQGHRHRRSSSTSGASPPGGSGGGGGGAFSRIGQALGMATADGRGRMQERRAQRAATDMRRRSREERRRQIELASLAGERESENWI